MDIAYGETELLRVNEFIEFVKRQQSHRKNYPDVENHCDTCRWTLSKLEALRKKTAEYAIMRKTDDDLIDWNILVLELLNEDTQSEEINSASPPKRARLEPNPAAAATTNEGEEGIGSKIEKLMAEKKAKEEADEIYNFEMDSFDDDEPEESGEDQEDEENEEDDQEDVSMEGTSGQAQRPAEPEVEAAEQPAEEAKVEQENESKESN